MRELTEEDLEQVISDLMPVKTATMIAVCCRTKGIINMADPLEWGCSDPECISCSSFQKAFQESMEQELNI